MRRGAKRQVDRAVGAGHHHDRRKRRLDPLLPIDGPEPVGVAQQAAKRIASRGVRMKRLVTTYAVQVQKNLEAGERFFSAVTDAVAAAVEEGNAADGSRHGESRVQTVVDGSRDARGEDRDAARDAIEIAVELIVRAAVRVGRDKAGRGDDL